jgi:hypothetical protein
MDRAIYYIRDMMTVTVEYNIASNYRPDTPETNRREARIAPLRWIVLEVVIVVRGGRLLVRKPMFVVFCFWLRR